MWRKIHSNRDPRDTLSSEVRKEFRTYFSVAGRKARQLFKAYPRFLFGLMVLSMSLSLIISFTLFRPQKENKKTPENKPNPVQTGFSQIMQATGNIRATLHLKSVVDSLSAKKILTSRDSTLLDSALDRLSRINHTLQ